MPGGFGSLFIHEEVGSTMTHRITLGVGLTVVLLAGIAIAADALESGPQVGTTIPGPFNPLNVTGEDAGEKRCLV
jgi:hypothetical protein